ncbi:MAG: thioesterase family protein [Acidimicrobiia bacterium]|nr:thioesterase family protein [Acidimicrobiia bacterium]
MAEALFVREGEVFHPTRLTEGPWSPDAQHGGPPSALLGRAIAQAPSPAPMMVARVSVNLLRPVPLEPLVLTTEITRQGKQVQLVHAALSHRDVKVAEATGLRLRMRDIQIPFEVDPGHDLPGPEEGRPARLFTRAGAYAEQAMEIRVVEGDFIEPGPGKAWFRIRVPVVAGEEPSTVERACAAADFGNGLSAFDPDRTWLFINPDLTVRFARPSSGEWVGMASRSTPHPTGTGLAESVLYDLEGRFGSAAQALLVEPLDRS